MKKKWMILATIMVCLLGATLLFGCSGNTPIDYTVYYIEEDGNEVWYSVANNGKWQDSQGNLGTYTEEDGKLSFYDKDGNYLFSGVQQGKMLALTKNDTTFFAVTEDATEYETTISLKTVYETATALGYKGTLEDLIAAFKGESAYESAVANGFTGTEQQWLESLKGEDGKEGKDGKDGEDGKDGKDGRNGIDGVSIASIKKTATDGNVDTYTISMTDGTKFNFTVTNGTGESTNTPAETEKYLSGIDRATLATVSLLREDEGAGSGVIYSIDKEKGDAIIITNAHMVYNDDRKSNTDPEYVESIKVYLYGSEVFGSESNGSVDMGIEAHVIGWCQQYDVAVIKITGSDAIKETIADAAVFTDSNEVYPGEDTFVIGNANGYGISVAQGIVSKTSQNVPFVSVDSTSYVYHRTIRVDAAVNPGNSGGSVCNAKGEVIGIVIGKTTTSLTESLGYCIPSNVVLAVAKNVISQYNADDTTVHVFQRPLVGVTIYTNSSKAVIDEETGKILVEEEVKVLETTEGKLSDGKLFAGDVIKSLTINDGDKIKVDHVYILTDTVMTLKVGDEITFEVERETQAGTEIVNVTMTIDEDSITNTK